MHIRVIALSMLTCIAFGTVRAQRMHVKRELGFDFTTSITDIKHYYNDIGAKVVREDILTNAPNTNTSPKVVRYVAFAHTPPFLSVNTSYINLGLIDGRIEVITIVTRSGKGTDMIDYKLHDASNGNVSVVRCEGVKLVRWSFENCVVEKEKVAVSGDSAEYYKYDILPPASPY